jgi:hypothetical protein
MDKKIKKTYTLFVVQSEGKRPLGRPRRRWEKGFQEKKWCDDVNWIHLLQDMDLCPAE